MALCTTWFHHWFLRLVRRCFFAVVADADQQTVPSARLSQRTFEFIKEGAVKGRYREGLREATLGFRGFEARSARSREHPLLGQPHTLQRHALPGVRWRQADEGRAASSSPALLACLRNLNFLGDLLGFLSPEQGNRARLGATEIPQ